MTASLAAPSSDVPIAPPLSLLCHWLQQKKTRITYCTTRITDCNTLSHHLIITIRLHCTITLEWTMPSHIIGWCCTGDDTGSDGWICGFCCSCPIARGRSFVGGKNMPHQILTAPSTWTVHYPQTALSIKKNPKFNMHCVDQYLCSFSLFPTLTS